MAHLVTRLDLGGAQQNTLYTVGHLDPGRFEVVLGCGEGGILDAEARELSKDGRSFRIRFFEELVREISPIRDALALLKLWSFLREEAPEIVHTHSSKAGILGRLAARLAGVPVVIHTYHGFGFHDRQAGPVRAFYVALERLCCRFCDRVVFVSEENRKTALRLGLADPEDCVLIRSGIRLAEFPAPLEDKARKKASLGCRMHKPMIAGVGNLKPQKNPEAFLRVAERVLGEFPDCSFVFLGDGELRPRLEARVLAAGLQGRVFFPGWRRDAAEILAAADAFVLTSLWEGLPRALVEAMRTGLPCVCYATDGVLDLLQDGENGFLVRPEDEEGLAARLVELLEKPELRRAVGAKAAASIGTEFDIDGMVRSQEKLYIERVRRRGL